MRFQHVMVDAVETILPPRVVTSDEIEQRLASVYRRLKLPFGRLEMMSGIQERRFWEPGTRPSVVAAQAGEAAIEASGLDRNDLGCVIHAGVCRDVLEPATASMVHERLRLPATCAAFDLTNACLGVLSAMTQVAAAIELGQIRAGLIVTGETAEPLYEATVRRIDTDSSLTRQTFKSHFASLTIGSGAAAVLLRRAEDAPGSDRLLGGAMRMDSSANDLCREDTDSEPSADGPLMNTDSEALLHAGCRLAERTWQAARETLAWTESTPAHVFTHQVGSAHRRLLFETVGLDPQCDYPTVHRFGNTGSAALPMAWALGRKEKTMVPGAAVALLGIGSGLSSLMLGVACGEGA